MVCLEHPEVTKFCALETIQEAFAMDEFDVTDESELENLQDTLAELKDRSPIRIALRAHLERYSGVVTERAPFPRGDDGPRAENCLKDKSNGVCL